MYIPANYEKINIIDGLTTPSTIKEYNNAIFDFWCRALFQRACSVIEFTDLPFRADVHDFWYYLLFRFGYCCVFNHPEYGFTFQPATLSGVDWYYQFNKAIVTNPNLKKSLEMVIHEDCEIVKLTPDYQGIFDVIYYFAEQLTLIKTDIDVSLINAKLAYIIAARNKAAAETLKKALDLVNQGNPAVVLDKVVTDDKTDKKEPWQLLELQNIKDKYLTTDLLMDAQTILNQFDREIGIATAPYFKKERLTDDEVQSGSEDSHARLTVWLETLNTSLDAVNKHYGTSIRADVRYTMVDKTGAEEEGGEDDG